MENRTSASAKLERKHAHTPYTRSTSMGNGLSHDTALISAGIAIGAGSLTLVRRIGGGGSSSSSAHGGSNAADQKRLDPPQPAVAERIGFVGLGNIGSRKVLALLHAGVTPVIFDTDAVKVARLARRGATPATSLAELARACDVVITSLPTPDIVREAVLGASGLLSAMPRGALLVEMSTNGVDEVRALAAACAARGVGMVDAPINDAPIGTRCRSGTGTLALLVSGAPQHTARALPVLRPLGDEVIVCGPAPGLASTCKLIHNAVNAVACAIVGEGATLGARAGVELGVLVRVLQTGGFGQSAGDVHGLKHYWLSRRFESAALPAFRAELLRKDLRLALALADGAGAPAPLIASAKADYDELCDARGLGGRACTIVRTLQEERAGTGRLALRMDEREKRALMRAACQLDVHEYDDDALGKFADMLDAAKAA